MAGTVFGFRPDVDDQEPVLGEPSEQLVTVDRGQVVAVTEVVDSQLVHLGYELHGSELPFNALRLAGTLAKRDGVHIRLFLMGDAVASAMDNQDLPGGYYHLDRMLKSLACKGSDIGCCGTCLDARGIGKDQLLEGARRSTMEERVDWTLEADRIVIF